MANLKDDDYKLTQNDMIDAIRRSGYLLEAELSEILSKTGFFVESNRVIKDPVTGKSREIDLIAEYDTIFSERKMRDRVIASTKFIIEAKNNPHPMVLMTNLKWNPSIELTLTLKEVITETEGVHHSLEDGFFGRLIGFGTIEETNIYTQYCTFRKKKDSGKDELMAWHPDEFHEGLMKIIQYCDEEMEEWEDSEPDDYLRDFLYLPVIVLGGDLYELKTEENNQQPILQKVDSSKLLYNYHKDDVPRSGLIYVVTRHGFSDFIKKMLDIEQTIEEEMRSKANRH